MCIRDSHKSAGKPNNERLEFLGDAILNAIVATELYNKAEASEGQMTTLRAQLVNGSTLAAFAEHLGIDKVLELGLGERANGKTVQQSILEDAFEALIGAVYLDSDYACAERVVNGLFKQHLGNVERMVPEKDPKTALQELMQAKQCALPIYTLTKTEGPPHQREFTVSCAVEVSTKLGLASAGSRREAERRAAQHLWNILSEAEN